MGNYAPVTLTATIAEDGSLSDSLHLNGAEMVGIVMPAAWTTANLTFQVSADGTTYNDLYNILGEEVNIPAGAARYIELAPVDFCGFMYIKVRSGTAGTPVAQGAARMIGVVTSDL